MEKISERLNFYDILAMVIPGGVWLLCLATIFDQCTGWDARQWLWVKTLGNAAPEVNEGLCLGLLLFVVAYIIGLASDSLTHWIRDWRREKKRDGISKAANRMVDDIKKSKKTEKEDELELLEKIIADKKELYNIRKKAMSVDHNSTILTIEYQCAMIKSLLLPMSILVGLCFSEWYWELLSGLVTLCLLCLLLKSRTKRLLQTILRHYNSAIKNNL